VTNAPEIADSSRVCVAPKIDEARIRAVLALVVTDPALQAHATSHIVSVTLAHPISLRDIAWLHNFSHTVRAGYQLGELTQCCAVIRTRHAYLHECVSTSTVNVWPAEISGREARRDTVNAN